MIPFAVLGLAAVFIWAMIKAGGWAAANPSIIAIIIVALSYAALHFWHKRRIAEIEAMDIDVRGRFKRVSRALNWPRYCLWCGATFAKPAALNIHNDPRSACSIAALAAADPAEQPEVDAAPPASSSWTATVITEPPGADTFTDDPAAIGAREDQP